MKKETEANALAALREDALVMRRLRSGHRQSHGLLLEAEGSFIDGYQRRWRTWEGEWCGPGDVRGVFSPWDNYLSCSFASLRLLFSFLAQECNIV